MAAPAPPPVATAVFGAALGPVVAYADLLASVGVERGLIGPREVERLWSRHLLNCAVVADLLPEGTVVDVGSGAGLPGIVLALLRPTTTFVLLDATQRRTRFLDEVVARLGLSNVVVRWARAEDVVAEFAADAVVARAVAPLDRLAGWGLPLLRVGGELLAMKGDAAESEVAAASSAIARAGGGDVRIETLGSGVIDPPTRVVRVRRIRPSVTRRGKAGRRER